MPNSIRVEYAADRKIRARNTSRYRAAHWPIWIWVFFLAPGPLTFGLFEHGGSRWNLVWLAVVLAGTGVAAYRGQLPGAEPAPYILRFTEDKPNPFYRRICYTFAWNALLSFALLNLAGLIGAVITGIWYLKQIYWWGYIPLCLLILALGAAGVLPRVRRSTQGEGWERRYFYGTVWAVTAGQVILMVLWKLLPKNHSTDIAKLAIYCAVLAGFAWAAALGRLPRTRPILPGEMMVAD
jgi:MFS family permease